MLRISARIGSVVLRRKGAAWIVSGGKSCTVPPARIERALENLVALTSSPTSERPKDGASFELQIAAVVENERVLHFDIADRNAAGDLVQLPDYSTFRVKGLDRELWSPQPADWCATP